jgi:hypothetical protein
MTSESPPGSPYQNRSTLPTLSPSRSIPPAKSPWADKHEDDDDMENVEYGEGNKETRKQLPFPGGYTNENIWGYGCEPISTHTSRSDAESLANNSDTPPEETSKGRPISQGMSHRESEWRKTKKYEFLAGQKTWGIVHRRLMKDRYIGMFGVM